ncbi:CASD1-like protein [Mya arenaria]|uniref:CASD1-like protein n=1 Tax=Mya arenaria TaxID=6604 RepID=A0ABY7EP88_MYAAR|nr:CASD1-like protein [Mya arenaria]
MADKSSSATATHEITYYLNIENAKILAFIMVSGFVVYHGFIHVTYSDDSCKDSRMCMHYISYWGGHNHITFLGDSRIRQLYFEFVNLLSREHMKSYKTHSNISYHDEHIQAKVDFVWMPYVNVSMNKLYQQWMMKGPLERPNLVVTGSATSGSSVKVWSSSRLVAQGLKKELDDGIHLASGSSALSLDVQMLMNMYCNDHMNHDDGTCCKNGQSNEALKPLEAPSAEPAQSLYEVLKALSRLGLIMAYFYLCDRTNFFMKENKYYTHVNFFLPFTYVMILGFFFTESTDKVLFRMNLLVVTLCFVMNRQYQFYYFVPLVSFWFIVVYVTMAVWPRVTEKRAEACVSDAAPEAPVCHSVVFGMVFAFGYQILKRYKVIHDTDGRNMFSTAITWTMAGVGVIGIVSYAAFSGVCRNKEECNEVHSYITFVPLFISQYHVWLAADTHGVLVMIPSYPVLNVILTSFIFICVSHEISKITSILTIYAVPSEWKALLRNVVILGFVLIPLCISRGLLVVHIKKPHVLMATLNLANNVQNYFMIIFYVDYKENQHSFAIITRTNLLLSKHTVTAVTNLHIMYKIVNDKK